MLHILKTKIMQLVVVVMTSRPHKTRNLMSNILFSDWALFHVCSHGNLVQLLIISNSSQATSEQQKIPKWKYSYVPGRLKHTVSSCWQVIFVKTITWVRYKFSKPRLRDYGCFHTVVFQGITQFCFFWGGGEYLLEPFLTDGLEECQGYGHHHHPISFP